MVQRIASATGKSKIMLSMPLWLMKTGATLFDWLPFYPVTRDQLIMLGEGNTGSSETLEKLIARRARAFSADELRYLAG